MDPTAAGGQNLGSVASLKARVSRLYGTVSRCLVDTVKFDQNVLPPLSLGRGICVPVKSLFRLQCSPHHCWLLSPFQLRVSPWRKAADAVLQGHSQKSDKVTN